MAKATAKRSFLIAPLALLALAGCSTADPTAGYPAYVSSRTVTGDASMPQGFRDTGTYPRLNDEPLPSLDQLTDAQRIAYTAQMRRLNSDLQSGRITTESYAERLRKLQLLAREHSPDMISQIEREAARDRATTAN